MIPTYNQENFIIEAINSALDQSYKNIEVIVCDDSSSDRTYNIAMSIKNKKLRVFKNDTNIGRVKNYHKILYDLSKGDFVINLDGDDYFIDNDYIKKCVALIKKHNVDLVFSNQTIKYDHIEKTTNMKLSEIVDGNWLFLNYGIDGLHIPHMTALYNRQKALKLEFYQQDIISTDWESLLRFIINSKLGFIKESSGAWRQVQYSESKVQDIQKVFKNFELVNRVVKFAKDYFQITEMNNWQNRINSNLIKDINIVNISCHFLKIVHFSYKRLSKIEFVKLLLNYRFIGKLIVGKFKYSCAQ